MVRKSISDPKQAFLITKTCEDEEKEKLKSRKNSLEQIYGKILDKIKYPDLKAFSEWKIWELKGDYLKEKAKPEDFTTDYLIVPLLKLLGYSEDDWTRQKAVEKFGKKKPKYPDFELKMNSHKIPIEVKPLNHKIEDALHQLEEYMDIRGYSPDYGIATNGTIWILMTYENHKEIRISLENTTKKYFGISDASEKKVNKEIVEFFCKLSKDRILYTFQGENPDKLKMDKPTSLDGYIS